VSVVLEACPEAAGVGYGDIADQLPLQELLGGGTEVRADRAFLALPKYIGFFEAFLSMSLLRRQICQKINVLHSGIFTLSADPNGLRGQPGGDLSSGVQGCLYINAF
jgi:hypothetical protein